VARNVSDFQSMQTAYGAHPGFYSKGTGSFFPRAKAAWREVVRSSSTYTVTCTSMFCTRKTSFCFTL